MTTKDLKEYTYKISDENVVELWHPGQDRADAPMIRQDVKPDGSAWESAEEAEAWAIDFIEKREAVINPPVEETPVVE